MFFMTREGCLYGAMICMLHYFWLIIKGRKKCKTKENKKQSQKILTKNKLMWEYKPE